MTLLLQDTLVISPKTKQQVDKNTAAIAELQEKAAIAYHFKGSKPTFNDLPTTGNEVGDVWDVKDTGVNYGWTEEGTWDELGPLADLEPYLTKEEATSTYLTQADATETYPTKIEVEEALKTAGSGYDALSAEQRDVLLDTGLYNGEEVNDAEVFTQYDGKFVEVDKTLNLGGDWNSITLPTRNPSTYDGPYDSVCWGNGVFVAVNEYLRSSNTRTYSYVATSTNGKDWVEHTTALDWTPSSFTDTRRYFKVLFANGLFFMPDETSGSQRMAVSSDGQNWSEITINTPTEGVQDIVYFKGKYIMSDSLKGSIYISDDYTNWTQLAEPVNIEKCKLAVSPNKIVAVKSDKYANQFYYSDDGVNWTSDTLLGNNYYQDITYGKDKFVITTGTRSYERNTVLYSEDGVNWNTSTMPSWGGWTNIIYDETAGLFLAVDGRGTSEVGAYSEDGINWTSFTRPKGTINRYGLTSGNGIVVAVPTNLAGASDLTPRIFYANYKPFYEYALTDLSLNKTEVNTEISAVRTEFDTAVTSIMITAEGEPTTATVGALGQLYKDTATGLIYRCKTVDTTLPSYEWEELGSKVSGNFYRSLSDEQKTILLDTGNYDEEEVVDGEIFTTATGTFVQYKIVVENDTTTRTLEQLSYNKAEVDALLNQAYVTTSWTIPLPVADWVENKQIFTIQGLTVDSSVDLNPVVPTTREEMIKLSNAGLFISALGENSVTIECMNLPTEDLVVRLKREMTTNLVLDGINTQLAEINGV